MISLPLGGICASAGKPGGNAAILQGIHRLNQGNANIVAPAAISPLMKRSAPYKEWNS